MAMAKWGSVTTSVGEYKAPDGKMKKRYLKIGVVMQDTSSGRMSAHLDALPTSRDWDGWLALWPDDEDDRNSAGFSKTTRVEDDIVPF